MKTRSWTMAAEDLTGPAVLKVQSKSNRSGRVSPAMPANAGPPRNIGQSPRTQQGHSSHTHKAMCRAAIMRNWEFKCRTLKYRAGETPPQIKSQPAAVTSGSPHERGLTTGCCWRVVGV